MYGGGLLRACLVLSAFLVLLGQAAESRVSDDGQIVATATPVTALTVPAQTGQQTTAQATSLTRSDGAALSLGFVNLRRIMVSIPQLVSMRARLDSEFAEQKTALDKQADTLQQLEDQLSQMPRGDAYSALEKQVIAKRRSFARANSSFRDAYSVRRNEELATLQQLVVDEIVALAKEQGYDIILNDTGVIYVSPHADLTNQVIERLKQRAGQNKSE